MLVQGNSIGRVVATVVAAAVVGLALDGSAAWRATAPITTVVVSAAPLRDIEGCATAPVDPETAAIHTPGASPNAWRPADLLVQSDLIAPITATVVAPAVIRLAFDGRASVAAGITTAVISAAAANHEDCAATPVDPETSIIYTPAVATNAW